jgi:multiple antibiotic resistance protein
MSALGLALASLFPLLNPFAALPLFAQLTSGMERATRNRTARTAAIAVLIILVVAVLGGRYLLEGLGVSLPALQVAGGVVVGATALRMVTGADTRVRQDDRPATPPSTSTSVGVVPLAIPMIAGPGAISVSIALVGRFDDVFSTLWILLAALIMSVIVWILLRFGQPLLERLGTTGIGVLTRVFGLVILAIAVQLVAEGATQLFPALKG